MITDFLFDGRELSSFGYMPCTFNSTNFETMPVSTLTYHTVKAPFSDTAFKTSVSYDSNLSTTITICKHSCDSAGLPTITAEDISELSKWLCRKEYKWLHFITDDSTGVDEVYYEAQINLQKVMLGDRCIGLDLTINTNRPYGLTQEIVIQSQLDQESDHRVNLHVYSDEEGYIYPDMVISIQEAGTLEITNEFDGKTTIIQDCLEGEVIHLHGNTLQITSTMNEHDIASCFNYQFPRLYSSLEESTTRFIFNLDCDVTFRYRAIRKVGI